MWHMCGLALTEKPGRVAREERRLAHIVEPAVNCEMWDYILYLMNAPFGRTRVTRGWNPTQMYLVLYDHTFSNLSGMERECARTVRSSSKASNPTFQPLIGSQEPTPVSQPEEPTPEVLVPVIKVESTIFND